ncbi:MAG: tRNA 2-thiouridine(34) synthase MnmA [Desulfovermiculus sp.]
MPVAVALSGGADSLLALCLLQEQGYDPVAVHASFLGCGPKEQRLQEQLAGVCAQRGVALHCLDLQETFEQQVIYPFVQAYARGLTPNPCAWCNRRIKFGKLVQEVQGLGSNLVATGHYATLRRDCRYPPGLYRGRDAGKDQSYFLALVSREQLEAALFPLSGWRKEEVRAELARRGLSAVTARESQEICFIPHNDYRIFLNVQGTQLPGPGKIVDSYGRFWGWHEGLHKYTVGQRRGLGIAYSEPLYVLKKDVNNNTLMVGPRSELHATSCRVRLINDLVRVTSWPEQVWVQTNYRQPAGLARVQEAEQGLAVLFDEPRSPAAPGQIAVFYSQQGRVLGGGEIHG